MLVRTLNAEIHRSVDPSIDLECGAGYWYFVYDDGVDYETHSVMVCRLHQLTREQWLAEAWKLSDRVERIRAARRERVMKIAPIAI